MDSSAGCRCREAPNHRFLRCALIGAVAVCATACQRQAADTAAEKPRPQQAGQAVDPYATAGHLAGARAALLTGNQQAAQQHVEAMARDVARSARLRDTRRPIDHEAARAALRPIPGVRSAIWLDADNLAVMVDGQTYRNMDMIDRLCVALEPLGDTLGVVVNLQDAKARNGDEATTLSQLSVAGGAEGVYAGEAGGGCSGVWGSEEVSLTQYVKTRKPSGRCKADSFMVVPGSVLIERLAVLSTTATKIGPCR